MKTVKTMEKLLLAMVLVFALGACGSKTKHQDANASVEQNTTVADDNTGTDGNSDSNTTTDGGTDDNTSTGGSDADTTTGGGDNDDNATTGNDDNTTTGGEDNTTTTPTATLSSLKLTIDKTSLNKNETATLQVEATYDDHSTKDATDKVEWVADDADAIKITAKTLKALQDKPVKLQARLNGKLSNKITLSIYWKVGEYMLPPEPDKALNDSTLLGIDVNDNSVRDDVERWIYATYEHPIERAVFMQLAKALQYRMGHADEAWKYRQPTSDAVTCSSYWEDPSPYPIRINNYKTPSDDLNPIQYNTQLRKSDYEEYQKALSGGVIEDNGLEPEEWIQKCDFNAAKLMKDYK